jgi:hypothetical protein
LLVFCPSPKSQLNVEPPGAVEVLVKFVIAPSQIELVVKAAVELAAIVIEAV